MKLLRSAGLVIAAVLTFIVLAVDECPVVTQPVTFSTSEMVKALSLPDVSQVEQVTLYATKSLHSSERIARKGILITRPGAKATIVVMHAYTSNKVDAGFMRLIFPNFNLLLFDFRGHGEFAEGQCSTLGHDEVMDVFGAVDFCRQHEKTKNLPLLGYGFSMGAATAIEAQAADPTLFEALILDCPFDSSHKLVSRGMDKMIGKLRIPLFNIEFELPGRGIVEQFAFNEYVQPIILFILKIFASMDSSAVPTRPKAICPVESSKKIFVPCFFITCIADATVPFDAVYDDYQHVCGFKWLWLTDGARHFGSIFHNPELYQEMVNSFVQRILSKSYVKECQQQFFTDVSLKQLEEVHKRLYAYQLPPQIVRLFEKRGVCS